MKKVILVVLLFLALFNLSVAAILTTELSNNQIVVGDTFNLIINASQSNSSDTDTPDVSPLQKNFTVLDTMKNQSLTIVNSDMIKKDQWVITLAPKITGALIVPSIKIGNNQSAPIAINVTTTRDVLTNGKQDIFISATVNPKNPYVQSQILYQLKIYYDINIAAASIYPPQANNSIIKQLGQDKISSVQIKGKSYHVFQRTYAIFPQNSGQLEISPAIFRGEVADKSVSPTYAGFSVLDVKPIQLITSQFELSVQPVPANLTNLWWLPASNLNITENWSTTAGQIIEGNPLIRIITIKATGLTAAQLPEISVSNSSSYNSYVSPATIEDTIVNDQLVAIKTIKIVYIPSALGSLTLPSIKIPWWNTTTNQTEISSLPTKIFSVVPGLTHATIESAAPVPIIKPLTLSSHSVTSHLYVWIITLFILLCLFAFFIWRKFSMQKHMKKNHSPDILKKACTNNNAQATKNALIVWARIKFKDENIFSLSDFIDKIDEEAFLQELEKLQKKLYKHPEMVWSGQKLWECCKSFNFTKRKVSINIDASLPEMYPN